MKQAGNRWCKVSWFVEAGRQMALASLKDVDANPSVYWYFPMFIILVFSLQPNMEK